MSNILIGLGIALAVGLPIVALNIHFGNKRLKEQREHAEWLKSLRG